MRLVFAVRMAIAAIEGSPVLLRSTRFVALLVRLYANLAVDYVVIPANSVFKILRAIRHVGIL